MSDTSSWFAALLVGVLFGVTFFGGLWWTVQKCVSSEWAAAWFLGSLLLRVGTTLAGFYLVSRNDWRRILACLLGFSIAWLAGLRLGAGSETKDPLAGELNRES